jgi:hypothetical protein
MTEPKVNRDEIARLMGSELGRGRIIGFYDCAYCNGSGQVMGGDEYQQCPDCRLRARRPTWPSRNKWAGACERCAQNVPVGEGLVHRSTEGKWHLVHRACPKYTTPAADALALMASELLPTNLTSVSTELVGPIEQPEPEEREGSSRDAFSPPAMTPALTDTEWYAAAEGDPLWARFLDGDR